MIIYIVYRNQQQVKPFKTFTTMANYIGVMNGMAYNTENNEREYLNAHISYKGRSIVIDYEHTLHPYPKQEGFVPFEVYPYNGDIAIGRVKTDERFGKADIASLLEEVEKLLAEENK